MDQLTYTDSIIRNAPAGKFHNPPGLYVRHLGDNVPLPAQFRSGGENKLLHRRRPRNCQVIPRTSEDINREIAYDDYVNNRVDRLLEDMPKDEYLHRWPSTGRGYDLDILIGQLNISISLQLLLYVLI